MYTSVCLCVHVHMCVYIIFKELDTAQLLITLRMVIIFLRNGKDYRAHLVKMHWNISEGKLAQNIMLRIKDLINGLRSKPRSSDLSIFASTILMH